MNKVYVIKDTVSLGYYKGLGAFGGYFYAQKFNSHEEAEGRVSTMFAVINREVSVTIETVYEKE